MKNIILKILKEIGIALVIFVVLIAAVIITFKDQLPYDEEIREGEEYVKADLKSYSVSSSDRISEVEAITVTHEANSNQITEAENEVRIQTGKYTPFGTISGTSDLPTEKVGTTINIAPNTSNNNASTNQNSASANKGNELEYPVTDEAIRQIEEEQSESAESAAERRFSNEE